MAWQKKSPKSTGLCCSFNSSSEGLSEDVNNSPKLIDISSNVMYMCIDVPIGKLKAALIELNEMETLVSDCRKKSKCNVSQGQGSTQVSEFGLIQPREEQ